MCESFVSVCHLPRRCRLSAEAVSQAKCILSIRYTYEKEDMRTNRFLCGLGAGEACRGRHERPIRNSARATPHAAKFTSFMHDNSSQLYGPSMGQSVK